MADPPTQIRFRGDGPDVMAQAILTILRHARESTDEFTFGPLRLYELERDGLIIGGPDLPAVMAVLARVPGLAQTEI